MLNLFAVEVGLGPLGWSVVVVSVVGFLVMFGISSAKGGYQDLIKTTLDNDELARKKKKNQ